VSCQLQIVGAERVVVEVVLDRPQHVEAGLVGESREPDLLVLRLIVGHAVSAVSGQHHPNAYFCNSLPAGASEMLSP
jgi:hypothetical protein